MKGEECQQLAQTCTTHRRTLSLTAINNPLSHTHSTLNNIQHVDVSRLPDSQTIRRPGSPSHVQDPVCRQCVMTQDQSCPPGRVADLSQPLDVHSTSLFSMNTLLTLLHQGIFCVEQSSQRNPHFTLRLSHDSKQDSRCWPGSCHR